MVTSDHQFTLCLVLIDLFYPDPNSGGSDPVLIWFSLFINGYLPRGHTANRILLLIVN